jgi:hypothetical protein
LTSMTSGLWPQRPRRHDLVFILVLHVQLVQVSKDLLKKCNICVNFHLVNLFIVK